MMRSFLIATVAVAMVGCGTEMTEDGPDAIESADKADAVYPYGAYEAVQRRVGEVATLRLNHDKTYELAIQVIDCIPQGPWCGPQKGEFKFSHTSTTKYIRFYENGSFVDRYAYKFDGTNLQVRPEGSSAWVAMKKVGGVVGDSCGGFVFKPQACAPGLECIAGRIPDVPGTCQDPGANPCVAAGGKCVALVPGSCDNGAVGDARQYSCGGGLGVECCLPKN
jgi:hypothetical protein